MKILSPAQMQAVEKECANHGISQATLMENAGKSLAKFICEIYEKRKEKIGRSVTFIAGSGNNGGDCFVAARELIYQGFSVSVVNVCGKPKSEIAEAALKSMPTEKINFIKGYQSENVRTALEAAELDYMTVLEPPAAIVASDSTAPKEMSSIERIMQKERQRIERTISAIKNADIVVDGVFGTGFHDELDEEIIAFFKAAKHKIRIAVDVPSGGYCANGCIAAGIFNAHYTAVMGCLKSGMTQYPLKAYCGEVVICDIGIPDEAYDILKSDMTIELACESFFSKIKKKRYPDSHKGDFGKLLVIAGSEKMRGACALAVMGALRCGVGTVTTASVEKCIDTVAVLAPESMFITLNSDCDGFISYESNLELLDNEIEKADAIMLGCGLGVTTDTAKLTEYVVQKANCPVIIDADGINCLADNINILTEKNSKIILTPHPGEMARLTELTVDDVNSNRINIAFKFASDYNVTVILKGAATVIASSEICMVNSTGNTGMSRGGSGDVLAGITASFAAQGYSDFNSAAFAAFIHGKAGDIAAEKLGAESMLPTDTINELSTALKSL